MKLKILFLLTGLAAMLQVQAQESYKVSKDADGNKVIVGQMDMQQLANDSAFSWFYTGVNKYKPNQQLIKYISAYRDSFDVVVFAGTWCLDTRQWLPPFYRVMMASSYPMDRIHLYGVDHDLHALNDEAQNYHVTKTPTFLFLRKGKEIGRIEEQPKSTSIESDIVAIIDKMVTEENKKGKQESSPTAGQ